MTIYWDRLAPGDQWDQHLLELLLNGELYPHGLDIRQLGLQDDARGLILMVPGRYHQPEKVSLLISDLDWVLAIRTGDEEDTFDPSRVEHPNIKWWVQTPRFAEIYPAGTRFIPLGFPPHFSEMSREVPPKELDVFLSAQNTHPRRKECFEQLGGGDVREDNRLIQATEGFTQGMPRGLYAEHMRLAKVAPCPAGPASPDTFRVYEALEAHAVPIADDVTPAYKETGYWRDIFKNTAPFPVLTDYESLPDYIETVLAGWPGNANQITAWWMKVKRRLALNLVEDLTALGAVDG